MIFAENMRLSNGETRVSTEVSMKKLYKWLQTWFDGKEVRGIKNVSIQTRYEIANIYNAIVYGEKPEFINGKCKEILDKAGIKTIVCGIGWKVA